MNIKAAFMRTDCKAFIMLAQTLAAACATLEIVLAAAMHVFAAPGRRVEAPLRDGAAPDAGCVWRVLPG